MFQESSHLIRSANSKRSFRTQSPSLPTPQTTHTKKNPKESEGSCDSTLKGYLKLWQMHFILRDLLLWRWIIVCYHFWLTVTFCVPWFGHCPHPSEVRGQGKWQPVWPMTILATRSAAATHFSSDRRSISCDRNPARKASPAPVVSRMLSGGGVTSKWRMPWRVAQMTDDAPRVITANRSSVEDHCSPSSPVYGTSYR